MEPILAYLDWSKEFHVHVDVSNYVIRSTLVQIGTHKLDHLIYFANQLLSRYEQNYSTTKREALGMGCIVQNFCQFLLATPFIFYVNYQALLYMINEPVIQERISCWLLLL